MHTSTCVLLCCSHSLLTSAAHLAGLTPAGNRAYADSVVQLLDPSGQLFGNRIIAQVGAGQEHVLLQGTACRGWGWPAASPGWHAGLH